MTIQINRNIYWSQLFVKQLAKFGVKDVCLSPGSRNTPLTYAFAKNTDFEKFISIDERSSGYFALGLAKKSKTPVAVVTTSGTAVAELYPSIIEAYNQRIPLIICTADRPHYLRNTGANQTINQENIYSNHIRYFYDTGLPEIKEVKLNSFLDNIEEGFDKCNYSNIGPVHFNFPFEKPFEPDSFTDEIKTEVSIKNNILTCKNNIAITPEVFQNINEADKVVAIVGPNNFDIETLKKINKTVNDKNVVLFSDSASGLRYLNNSNSINNHTSFLRIEKLFEIAPTDVMILFGEAPVSNSVLNFIEKTNCLKYSVNSSGDLKDPSRTVNKIIKTNEIFFLDEIENKIEPKKIKFRHLIESIDLDCEDLRINSLEKSTDQIESNISANIINSIPENSNLFIGNSTVIRDFDLFSGKSDKNINVFSNRGTSGIEGNIATTLGIAKKSKNPSFLVLGDLSFYYDSNSLLLSKQNNIPLTIIIINNNGGGIFSMLPISNQTEIFDKFFNTSHHLDFRHFANLYSGNYFKINSKNELNNIIENKLSFTELNILEIKTDSKKSTEFRKNYIKTIRRKLIH